MLAHLGVMKFEKDDATSVSSALFSEIFIVFQNVWHSKCAYITYRDCTLLSNKNFLTELYVDEDGIFYWGSPLCLG